jgi:parallel beta-helix repeat protein
MTENDLNIIVEKPSNASSEEISVALFGASTESCICNHEAFRKAIEHCAKNKIHKLIVPKGKYFFHSEGDNVQFHLHFKDLKDFIFDAQDSEFIFTTIKPFIKIENCERCIISNFTLDWYWEKEPLASIGRVINVHRYGDYFDCLFPFRTSVEEDMKIQIVTPFNSSSLTAGCSKGIEFRPYKNNFIIPLSSNNINDKMYNLVRELSNIINSVEKIGPNILRLYMTNTSWCREKIHKGQVYNFRHYEYHSPAVTFSGNNLTLENITIYSCPGHGFLGTGNLHHFHMKKCKIMKKPGTDRSISCTADGCHIGSSQGYFIMENCDFSYSGDDCLNIHDNSSMGIKQIDSQSIIVEKPIYFNKGDIIDFRNNDLSPIGFSSSIAQVEYIDAKCKLTFVDKLPDKLEDSTILFNKSYDSSNYIIRNNLFHRNRARGILIQSSNGIIEGNRFYNIQGAAIQIEAGAESRWSEGYGVRNVVFRNNLIESCDVNRWTMAIIYMGVYLPFGRTSYPIFSNITFEKNTITDCPRLAFFLSSCEDITLKNNVIINPNTEKNFGLRFGSSQQETPMYEEEYKGTIMASKASNIKIYDNKRIETVGTFDNGIYMSPEVVNYKIYNNAGF